MMDLDFWNQTVLSATNWLDTLTNEDFVDSSLASLPSMNRPSPLHALPDIDAHTASLSGPQGVYDGSQRHAMSPRSTLAAPRVAAGETPDSHISYETNQTKSGEYYVDGEPARLPRVKKRVAPTPNSTLGAVSPAVNVFSLQISDPFQDAIPKKDVISAHSFHAIQESYRQLCLAPSASWTAFAAVELPAKHIFEHLIDLYFEHFDQTLPFLHRTAFREVENNHALLLAIAALGSHYLEGVDSTTYSTSMHEFVRRILYNLQETCSQSDEETIPLAGARLLNSVGMAYCGDERMRQRAMQSRMEFADTISLCRKSIDLSTLRADGDQEHQFQIWRQEESKIRLAYCTWLVDSMWTYHFQSKSVLSLNDADLPLPCSERLWNTQNADEWTSLYDRQTSRPSLNEAMQQLYIDKQLSRTQGEFGRILIIHGMFHRSWEVERHYSNPLSYWEPTAKRQSTLERLPKCPIWLPSIPAFTKWQNSACDALDILHWQANATIGQASGIEHPTVLHLHQARIVLLTPYDQIVSLAQSMIRDQKRPDQDIAQIRHSIHRWAVQHQYKARLAAIHAGVVFWHLRRYSVDAFYEAPAVGLATLVLWAFGTFASRKASSRSTSRPLDAAEQTAQQQVVGRDELEQIEDESGEIILLDRPVDDELVQQFIRNGHTMTAYLSGVGDLYTAKGPERVLRQGCKLLNSLQRWGVVSQWLSLLNGLIDATSRGQGN